MNSNKKKILFLALSVSEEILNTHFYETFVKFIEPIGLFEYDVQALVYIQGFGSTHTSGLIDFVRDDTMFNKGYSISEIRDYFTQKAIKDYCPDYILICDDDTKFGFASLYSVDCDVSYLEKHPEVGMTNMHYHKGGHDHSTKYYDFNPSRVAARSGILLRTDAYVTWGGENKVTYFEECVLATYAYQKGYEIKHSVSDIIHKSKPSGLGLSLERKYGKSNIPSSGRRVLSELGLLVPCTDSEGNPRYDVPCKLSKSLQEIHNRNKERLLSNVCTSK